MNDFMVTERSSSVMTVTWFTTQNLLCGFIRGASMGMAISAPFVNVNLTLQCKKADMNVTANFDSFYLFTIGSYT